MNIRHLQLPLALALALGATGAQALGLGPIEVKSGLNQPLVAEIPILSAAPGEVEELEVRLASPEAFARVGLDRPVGLTANLQMEVGRNAAGQPVIRVTTPGRFSEPYLTFLLEANWGRGSVVREFSALVDPPYIAPAVIRPMQAPAVAVAPPAPVYEPPQAEVAPEVVTTPMPEPEDRLTVTEIDIEPEPEAAPMVEPLPPEPVAAAPEPVATPEPVAAAPEPEPLPVEPLPAPEPEPAMPEPEPEPAPAPELVAETPPPAPEPTPAPQPMPAPQPVPAAAPTLGPVQEGQTLWSLADAARLESAVTVNQMMLALQRANPDAFIDDNINQLKAGAVLRIPPRDEVVALGEAEAALLVREQANAWNSRRAPVPQPAESIATAPAPETAATPAPARPAASSARAPAEGRLEIVPPAGDRVAARAVQSGASESGGGSELRAELTQAREDLAAREAEIAELRSQLNDLEAQQADSQRLIQMQNSRMKALQARLARQQAEPDGQPADAAAAPAAAAPAPAAPWYLNPYVLGGGGVLLLGGLVFALRGRRRGEPVPAVSRRISDDDALKATLAGARPAAAEPEAVQAPVAVATDDGVDPALQRLRDAVATRPNDLEAHISLLRHYYAHGEVGAFETAAQAMRGQVRSTLDPRWREAVVMGVAMSPGNALFSQAGWNAPKFGDSGVMPAAPPRPAAVPPLETAAPQEAASALPSFLSNEPTLAVEEAEEAAEDAEAAEAAPTDVTPVPAIATPETPETPAAAVADAAHDAGLEAELQAMDASLTAGSLPPPDTDAFDRAFAGTDEDDGSATKIELARAYLDIGDVDGARGMLEEVLAEAGPRGRSEAAQLLKDIG